MKLSSVTLKILQYYSRLSEFIHFNVENKGFISTANIEKSLFCYYVLGEKEKKINEFVLYHYNEVLEMMKSLNENVEFEFLKNELIIKDDKTTFRYRYANKELINVSKQLKKLPVIDTDSDISFKVKGKELYKINKILKSMKMENYSLIFEGSKIYISGVDRSHFKNFKTELEIEDLRIENKNDFKIDFIFSSLRDLNFGMDYRVVVYEKLKILILCGILNFKKDDELIQKEIPFICLIKGEK